MFSCIQISVSSAQTSCKNSSELIRHRVILLGGGIPESRRALELSDILGVKILPSQV